MTPSPVVLSEDLIAEILSFLPVKSLLQFRCVSKSWKTLISDTIFVKLHLEKSQSRPKLFTIISMYHIRVNDNEYDVEYSVVRHPIDSVFENPSFTFFDNSHPYRLNNKVSQARSSIVGSCNGLVLLYDEYEKLKDSEYWLRVWNPATGTTSEKIGYFRDDETFSFAFGCDNSTGTYKAVAFCNQLTTSEVRVLNLGGDHVWRKIESFPVVPYRGMNSYDHVNLSSTLNWLSIHNNGFCYDLKDTTVEHFVIVSLDLETETYNQYTVPSGFDEVPFDAPTIGVLGGCLCFSYSYRKADFCIWKMDKFGVEDSWTQFLKISYHDLLINYDDIIANGRIYFKLVPLFLSEDGDSLILESNLEDQTILYNRRDNRADRTKITASRTAADNRTRYHLYCHFEMDYVESLVPIP